MQEVGPKKCLERIARLERRAQYLEDRVMNKGDSPNSIAYRRAEASALRWAVPILKDYVDKMPKEAAE